MSLLLLFLSLNLLSPASMHRAMDEDCSNGIDDDQDGLVDLNDPDCDCAVLEPVSLIPNPSFEDIDCCPDNRSQLNCAQVWIQASVPTTDLLNDCGWSGWDDLPPPRPFPDGDGILGFRDGRPSFNGGGGVNGNWKEYAGACLLNPLRAGTTYRFEFDLGFVNIQNSPDIDITFFGTTDCENLPFGDGDDEFGCPTNGSGWVELGSRRVSTIFGGGWEEVFIEVTPNENINAIAIGPDCVRRDRDIQTYYFFDNLLLDELESFNFNISGTDHPCSPDFRLQVPNRNDITYQWYMEGVALVGETAFRLNRNYGEGIYQVVIDDGNACRKSEDFQYLVPVINAPARVTIYSGESFRLGDNEITEPGEYLETLTSFEGCDSIVGLRLTVLGELRDTVNASIFPDESFSLDRHTLRVAGSYELPLTSVNGCDSIVELNLSYYQVFQPTAFSPNADGINDRFSITGGPELVEVRELRMFDRWGNFLASGKDWDGSRGGEPLSPGLYAYTTIILMDDGKERVLRGSVMLLR